MISFLPCPRLASRVRIGVLLRFTWVGNRIDGRVDDNGRWCVGFPHVDHASTAVGFLE